MQELSDDTLHCVLRKLDFLELLAAGATCRRLRQATAPHWQHLCRQRWYGGLNSGLYEHCRIDQATPAEQQQQQQQQSQGVDYKSIFLGDNGWADPRLAVQQYAGSCWSDELVAVQPSSADDGTCIIAVSSCRELRILELDRSPTPQLRVRRAANHCIWSAGEQWSSVAALPPGATGAAGLVAAGGCYGRLALFQLPEVGSSCPSAAAVQATASLVLPGNSCIITQLRYLPNQQRLMVLHDSLAHLRGTPAQRSMLSVVDAASWRHLCPAMHDVLDGYELAAAAAVGASGCEFIGGAVKLSEDQASGWACRRCYAVLPASLCWHKSAAASAALCVFDCRAPQGGMVARYSTHHRGLHPHLETVREHFLLTSHAGTPVAVWDRRQMNGPVHEVQHIPEDIIPAAADAGEGGDGGWGWAPDTPCLPAGLEHPEYHEQPASKALHLSATSDLLLGRADSGMCWLFDLSERMGWADGSNRGSWMRHWQPPAARAASGGGAGPLASHAAQPAAGWEISEGPAGQELQMEELHADESEVERAPLPLGCVAPPYEVWCSNQDEAAPLHWLPPAAAWIAHNRLVCLGGLELENKQRLFPAYAHENPYPSNALVVASLQRTPGPRHQH